MSSTHAPGSATTPTAPDASLTSVALIARQAIVNAQHVVIGYELFNRSRTGPTHTAATDVALVFKFHLFMGLTILFLFPFTRLVHMLSAPVRYVWRPGYQVVRSRKLAR